MNLKNAHRLNLKLYNYLIYICLDSPTETRFTMSTTHTNWTKEDFIIYTLLYCANADFVEEKPELDFIKSKIHHSNLENLKLEFSQDNDFTSIQKISDYIEAHNYSAEDKQKLVEDIRKLFVSDGSFDHLEHNLMLGLKKIIF